jgi:uncharacterized protein (DUF1684 family)
MSILDKIKKVFSGETNSPAAANPDPNPKKSTEEYYIAGIQEERAMKDRFLRMDPQSPLPDRADFAGLAYYDPNPAYRYTLPLQPAEHQEEVIFQTSTGDEQTFQRLGTIEFEVEGQPARLAIYQSSQHDDLFLPFRDATSGNETYGAGRYLEPHDLGGGELLVDFNLAYNPFCAYSDDYSCPLPPFENHLKTVAIRAGEKAYKK